MANIGPNESRDKSFPSIKCQRSSRRTDERVEVKDNFLSLKWKTILEGG
jgi:hypothetical protein